MSVFRAILNPPPTWNIVPPLAAATVACCADIIRSLRNDERLEQFLRNADAEDARLAATPPPPPIEQVREEAANWAHATTGLTVVIAAQQGDKRCGIRSHRAPGWHGALAWCLAGARWRTRAWWAATTPARPDEPVRRALAPQPAQTAPVWLAGAR